MATVCLRLCMAWRICTCASANVILAGQQAVETSLLLLALCNLVKIECGCVQVLRALIAEKQAVLGIQRELRDKMQQLKEGCPLDTLYD